MAPTAPAVNHLLFADYSLLLFKSSIDGANAVSNLLQVYSAASGQRINNSKSSTYFCKGCPQNLRDEMKQTLQVQNESLSGKYLGLPSNVGQNKNDTFKYLKDRVWGKLKDGWKKFFLMQGKKFSSNQ